MWVLLAIASATSSIAGSAGRQLQPSETSAQCTKPTTADGIEPGEYVRTLTECTERYSAELSCNGYHIVLSRVDRPGLDFWDVYARITNPNASAPQQTPDPVTVIEGTAMDQISHNAAYMCSGKGKLVAYGGRIRPADSFRGDPKDGHYPGLVRIEGSVSASGVTWSKPTVLLDEAKAKATNCSDGRRNHDGVCEFDGKLSVVEFKGDVLLFGRLNPKEHDYRHVQMSRSPVDRPDKLEPFQALEFSGYERIKANNIYFINVQARGDTLVGLFPAVIDGNGGIYYSESVDGVHWLKPQLLLASDIFGPRTDDYPVDGFVATASGLEFSVDHGIVLDHGESVDAKASQEGRCTPPHTCRYHVSGEALERLVREIK